MLAIIICQAPLIHIPALFALLKPPHSPAPLSSVSPNHEVKYLAFCERVSPHVTAHFSAGVIAHSCLAVYTFVCVCVCT